MSLEKEFSSIEELDSLLEEEEPQEVTEEETTTVEPETQEQSSSEEAEEQPAKEEEGETQGEKETETQEETEEKPSHKRYTPEEKRNYAFNQMRIENKNLKNSVNETNKFLERLAQASGYTDIESMKASVLSKLDAREAQKQGISPEIYTRLTNQEKAIKQLEEREARVVFNSKLMNFKGALDSIVNEYGFSKQDVSEMLGTLEKDGYTLEALVSQPNPSFIIKGAFGDKILKAQSQRALEQEKKQATLDSHKISNSTVPQVDDEDEEIARELKAYAKEHNYYYE